MKLNKKRCICAVLFLMASFAFLSSCNEPTPIQSKWRDKDIVINGNDNEWADCKLYSDPAIETDIGIYNDDNYVYMCFTTKDPDILTAIIKQGFIIWFNQTGAKDKQLGIHFPVVTELESTTGHRGDTLSVKNIEVLTSKNDKGKAISVADGAKLGMSVAIASDASGKFIYEIKMPLKKTDSTPYAIGVSANNNIGAGFMLFTKGRAAGITGFGGTTADMGSSGSGGGGGGMGGGGGDMGGGSGTGGGSSSTVGGGTTAQTIFEVWTNVTLASAQ